MRGAAIQGAVPDTLMAPSNRLPSAQAQLARRACDCHSSWRGRRQWCDRQPTMLFRPCQPLFFTSTKRFPRAGAVVPGQPRMRLQTPRQRAGTGVPFDMTKEATRRPPSTAGLVKAAADETTRRLEDARTPRHPVGAGLVKAAADGTSHTLEDTRTPRRHARGMAR